MIATWSTAQMRLLKCVGFASMLLDHGFKAGLWQLPDFLVNVGKLAFPLFVVGFAVLVAKSGQCRVWRLLALGVLAQPASMWVLGASWWDLNVLFVFVVGWWLYRLGRRGRLPDWMLAASLLAVANLLFKNQAGGLFWPLTVAFALWAASTRGWWRVVAIIGAALAWSALRNPLQVLTIVAVLAVIGGAIKALPKTWIIPRIEFGLAYVGHLFVLAICMMPTLR